MKRDLFSIGLVFLGLIAFFYMIWPRQEIGYYVIIFEEEDRILQRYFLEDIGMEQPKFIPASLDPYTIEDPKEIHSISLDGQFTELIYQTIFLESQFEPIQGQYAVYCVIQNRAKLENKKPEWVIKKERWFSCWNGRTKFNIDISHFITDFDSQLNNGVELTDEQRLIHTLATHYHNPELASPKYFYSKQCIVLGQIGNHIFYVFEDELNKLDKKREGAKTTQI